MIMNDMQTPEAVMGFGADIIAAASCGILVYEEGGQCVLANTEAAEIVGAPVEEVRRQNFRDLKSWRNSGMLALAEAALATGERQKQEIHSTSTFGKEMWISSKFSVFEHEGRKYLLLVVLDITKRVEAELATAKAKDFLAQIINAVGDPIFVKDRNHRMLILNEACCQLNRRRREEMVGKTVHDYFPAADAQMIQANEEEVFQTGQERLSEDRVTDSEGNVRAVVAKKTRYLDADGNMFLVGVVRDLTAQNAMEAALRESEALYQSLMRNLPCDVFRKDAAGRYVYVNSRFCEHNGLTPEQILGKTPTELTDYLAGKVIAPTCDELTDTLARQRQHLGNQGSENHRHIMQTGESIVVDEVMTLADGTKKYFQVIKSPVTDQTGRVIGTQGIQFDITRRWQAEEQLRKLSRAVEESPVSIIITDQQARIEYVNPKFVEMTGYTLAEVAGRPPLFMQSGEPVFGHGSVHKKMWATITAGNEWRGEFQNKKKSGETFWESVSISPIKGENGNPTHLVILKEDITRQKQLEGEFRQAQKMEAFGSLSAGVAHDFNNILTAILCNVEVMEGENPLDAVQAEALTEIKTAGERAANLTRQLLLFSRQKPMQTKLVQVNEVVENMGKMLRRLIGEHIHLKTQFCAGDTPVIADASMLEQVLLNLTVNSRDAMPEGGDMTIVTETVTISEATGRRRSGRFVCFSVSDTGSGISAPDMEHIFEPFFTTKEIGKGTGLGLATVFGIIEQHKGWIEVESVVGSGTTFHIFLPRHEAAADTDFIAKPNVRAQGGSETILLVEDEPALRKLARTILTRLGYTVHEAGSATAAIEVWQQHQAGINLLFTDMVMPGKMSGLELSQRLLQDKPGLKVVYTSGYTDEMLKEGSELRHSSNFLAKPYGTEVLLRKIRAALDN